HACASRSAPPRPTTPLTASSAPRATPTPGPWPNSAPAWTSCSSGHFESWPSHNHGDEITLPKEAGMSEAALFSQEWCEEAKKVWDAETYPYLADKEHYNYIAEWGVIDHPEQVCQFKAEGGRLLEWDAGQRYPEEEATFVLWAKLENWRKVA